jgi:thiamine kinase-like enzyme
LHFRGIHHHDVREGNVLVDERGNITLIDFDHAQLGASCIDCADMAMLERLGSTNDAFAFAA